MTNPTISAHKKQFIVSVLILTFAFIMAAVAGCGDPALEAPPCPVTTQWSPCHLGSQQAYCWTGPPCANGVESTCEGPSPIYPELPPPVVGCQTPTGLTCIPSASCETMPP